MALSNLSFKFYTDSELTIVYGGSSQLLHSSDLSDGPQDLVLYFASKTPGRKLQATNNPGVGNITLTPTDSLSDWPASSAIAAGKMVEPTTPNGYRYECKGAGTTGATEPTWPTVVGAQVSDGGVIWENKGARHETTEIQLAATAAGLDAAIPGAALSLGTTLTSGAENKIEVHMRVTNAVTDISSTIGSPDIGVSFNSITETVV